MAIHEQLLAAVDGRRGVEAADRLCEACVVLFEIDAATISLVFDGASSGTLGSSGAPARMYDELQFTLGEGPCLDSVVQRIPILAIDLADPREMRWPVYGPAMLAHQIRGVYAIPIVVAGEFVGALDLFCACFCASVFRLRRRPLRFRVDRGGIPLVDHPCRSFPGILDLASARVRRQAVGLQQTDDLQCVLGAAGRGIPSVEQPFGKASS